jgi:hypothetical protein
MIRYGKRIVSIAILLLLLPIFLFSRAKAQSPEPLNLSVTPVFYDLSADPGKEVKNKIRLRNNNDTPINLKIEIKKLSAKDVSGDIKLDDLDEQDDFASWVNIEKTKFTARAKEWTDIPFSVTVPEEAAFGYYWAFYVTPDKDAEPIDGAAEYTGAVAIPVLLNVKKEGAIVDNQIVSFKSDASFYEYLPVNFETLINNKGNVHIKPVGNIFIRNWRNEEIETLKFNDTGGNILPTSNRVFETKWNNSFITYEDKVEDGKVLLDKNGKPQKKLKFNFDKVLNLRMGRYYARIIYIVNDGQRDVPYEATTSFVVFPWKFAAGLALIIILAVIGLANTLKSIGKKIWSIVGHFRK